MRSTRARLEHAPELLDESAHDRAELEQSLDQVAEVNRLLGGQRAVLRALDELLTPDRAWTILDVGTGSADIPVAIVRRAHARGLSVAVTAADLHPQMREIALERTRGCAGIRVAAADALALPWDAASFDVVLLSLTLHHFESAEQRRALGEAARVARTAVVINELERCTANYVGARFLALTRWRRNRLTRHDGPLSVLRAFTKAELRALADDAGLRTISLRRMLFFRLVHVVEPRT
jgi:ubiquinone/menaquinone biosynthesis C-methylase UbiE